MKICFVCETLFQVLSCINYSYYQTEFIKPEIDIYVYGLIPNKEKLISGLKSTHLFHKVYIYQYKENNPTIIMKIKRIFFPVSFVYLLSDNKDRKKICNYNFVYISNMVGMACAMVFANRHALVRFYDDGLGSYLGNIFINNISKQGLLAHQLAGHKLSKFKPEVLYVFCKALCDKGVANKIIQMKLPNKEDKDYLEVLYKVFSYKDSKLYQNRNLVYFTQPYMESLNNKDNEKLKSFDKKIEAILLEYEKLGIVRVHPRQNIKQIGKMLIDDKHEMWELICLNEITESHVLVGNFSTAQVTPKLLYNKEPWIIFTYRIYAEFMDDKSLKERNNFVKKLKSAYQNPEKIIILENINQLKNLIQAALYPTLYLEKKEVGLK